MFLFHGGSGPLVVLLFCNSPQNTRVILTILFPESLLSHASHCSVQGFPDQSIILCDPGQWPLDLPRNGKCEWWVHQKRGFEGYIVLYQQPLLLMLTLQPPSLSLNCARLPLSALKSLPLPEVLPGWALSDGDACSCSAHNNGCPPADSVPIFSKPETRACERTPLDITHPIPIHLDVQRPGWFLFLSVIFSFFYRPPTPSFLSCKST